MVKNSTWTQDEMNILRDYYRKIPIDELMKLLVGRSKSAIVSRAHENKFNRARWTNEEMELLKIEYPNLKNSSQDFERMFNRKWATIQQMAVKLKIGRINLGSKSKLSNIERFMIKVDQHPGVFGEDGNYPTECWQWIANRDKDGYGKFYENKNQSSKRAHRFSYEYFKEQHIPNEMLIDHMCRNTSCVNPDHLRIVTPRINTIENSNSIQAINFQKTECSREHTFTGENLGIRKNGSRYCKACMKEYHKKYRLKKKESKNS